MILLLFSIIGVCFCYVMKMLKHIMQSNIVYIERHREKIVYKERHRNKISAGEERTQGFQLQLLSSVGNLHISSFYCFFISQSTTN